MGAATKPVGSDMRVIIGSVSVRNVRVMICKTVVLVGLALGVSSCTKQSPSDQLQGFDSSIDGVAIEPVVPFDGEHAEKMLSDRESLETWNGLLTPRETSQDVALGDSSEDESSEDPMDEESTEEEAF